MSRLTTLYCDSRGDRRYSALFAKVSAFGVERTIEMHYQLAKRQDGQDAPTTWRQEKGKKPDYLEIYGHRFGAERLSAWYALLWVWYLDDHPELVAHAQQFDTFVDRMAGKSKNRQDEMIAWYVKKGRGSLSLFCRGLLADLDLSDTVGAVRGEPLETGAATHETRGMIDATVF
jgi:hypothetical protein